MLVLLPPSEGKAAPPPGEPVDLAALAFAAELTERRRRLLAALAGLASMPPPAAIAALGVTESQAGEVAVDAALAGAPAAPAAEVYAGVLYDHLGLPGLPAAARGRVLIASALWGVLRPQDRIPYYRLSAKAKLPGIGGLAAFWRGALAEAMPDEPDGLILDMRSGAYSAFWKPTRATLLSVRAFAEQGGRRKAVSHMAKAVRGDVAKALLSAGKPPSDPEGAAALAEVAGFEVELGPGTLDVIV